MRFQRGLLVGDNFGDNFHGPRKHKFLYVRTQVLYVQTQVFMSGHNFRHNFGHNLSHNFLQKVMFRHNFYGLEHNFLCQDTTFYVGTQLFMSGHNFDTTFDTPMRSNFAPKSYPRVMSRHNFHTACTLPILPQKLSRRCTHAQTPRSNIMAYIRNVRGWKGASMARALPWAGIPCSPCTVVTRPKILVALLPVARGR